MAIIDEATRKNIIENSDSEALVNAAEKIGKDLALQYRLTASQIRGIFGTVRNIEMDWRDPSEQPDADRVRKAQREFTLLQPRIAYQAQRERGRGVQALKDELLPAMKLVNAGKGEGPEAYYTRFRNFVDFFEAILAYHRAFGGSNN